MDSYSWKIHKRLREATTDAVYTIPARGNNKPYTQFELYLQMLYGPTKSHSKLEEGLDYFIPVKVDSEDYLCETE